MNTHTNKLTPALMWVMAVAVILFSAVGTAAIMGWIPTSIGGSGSGAVVTDAANPVPNSQKNTVQPAVVKATIVAQANPATAPPKVTVAKPVCAECGVIESTREIAAKGTGTGLGAVGGAVVGGLLGSQIGGGKGQDVATVVGAVGGAVAGNEVEKRVKATTSYDVTVRMEDGSVRVVRLASIPTWRIGDHVKVVDGVIRSI